MYLELKLQYANCEWGIDKVKWRKIGTNEKNNCKQKINKVPFLFLELRMHKLR